MERCGLRLHRNLSVIKIPSGFEHAVTQMKTNCDEIGNKSLRGREGEDNFEQVTVHR